MHERDKQTNKQTNKTLFCLVCADNNAKDAKEQQSEKTLLCPSTRSSSTLLWDDNFSVSVTLINFFPFDRAGAPNSVTISTAISVLNLELKITDKTGVNH